jgi:3-phenylpropionate/cinnamic acid dioxygenase small subunit
MDLMDECFATDAEVEFMDSGLKVSRAEVAGEMRARRGKYADGSIPWHVISNVWITDDTDDRATVRSWYTFFIQAPDGSQRFASVGWYDDTFVLEDGAWRVRTRRVMRPDHR